MDFSVVVRNGFGSDSEQDVDYDDEYMTFCMASPYEDGEFNQFTMWLQSIDGWVKNERSANKHKSVLMLILRYDQNLPVKHSNSLNREFLYKWMVDAMVSGKESGTIKNIFK